VLDFYVMWCDAMRCDVIRWGELRKEEKAEIKVRGGVGMDKKEEVEIKMEMKKAEIKRATA
jgi:hypothetical protein